MCIVIMDSILPCNSNLIRDNIIELHMFSKAFFRNGMRKDEAYQTNL